MVVVINSFLTKADKNGNQWARVTAYDPASGLKAIRLFDADYLVAYPKGSSFGAQIAKVECEPYKVDGIEGTLNTKNTLILQGETEIQALARSHGKESIKASMRTAAQTTPAGNDVK